MNKQTLNIKLVGEVENIQNGSTTSFLPILVGILQKKPGVKWEKKLIYQACKLFIMVHHYNFFITGFCT